MKIIDKRAVVPSFRRWCVGIALTTVPILTPAASNDPQAGAPGSKAPDVWYRETPHGSSGITMVGARKLPDGDVLLLYRYQPEKGPQRTGGFTFFSYDRQTDVELSSQDAYPLDFPVLADGSVVRAEGSGGKHCNAPFYFDYMFRKGDVTQSRTLLYLRDRPSPVKASTFCEHFGGEQYNSWVEPLQPWIVTLDDGSFLLVGDIKVEGRGYALRIRPDLTSKYSAKHRRLFWVDPSGIARIIASATSGREASQHIAHHLRRTPNRGTK